MDEEGEEEEEEGQDGEEAMEGNQGEDEDTDEQEEGGEEEAGAEAPWAALLAQLATGRPPFRVCGATLRGNRRGPGTGRGLWWG